MYTGADAGVVDRVGLTPLHYAAQANAPEAIQALVIDGRAAVDVKSSIGRRTR
jgi:ankyrin repeat protein